MSDKIRTAPDVPYKPSGAGLPVRRHCMSCGQWRGVIGSAGVGLRWRCASCLQQLRKSR